jgi:hypothetical protein
MINDYLVRCGTANHDNVATELAHHKTNAFAIQNQASHLTFNLMLSAGRAAGSSQPAADQSKRTQKAPCTPYGVQVKNLL